MEKSTLTSEEIKILIKACDTIEIEKSLNGIMRRIGAIVSADNPADAKIAMAKFEQQQKLAEGREQIEREDIALLKAKLIRMRRELDTIQMPPNP